MARDSKIDHSLVRRREARYAEEFKERGSYQSQKRRDDMGQPYHWRPLAQLRSGVGAGKIHRIAVIGKADLDRRAADLDHGDGLVRCLIGHASVSRKSERQARNSRR